MKNYVNYFIEKFTLIQKPILCLNKLYSFKSRLIFVSYL